MEESSVIYKIKVAESNGLKKAVIIRTKLY